jgi:hypothetical protein
MLAYRYTPIVHLDPLLTSIKGRSRALVREGGRAGGRADGHALSLSLANACNPLLQAHPPWAQDNTSRGSLFFPLCSILRRPIWVGTRSDNLLVGPGTPQGRNVDNILFAGKITDPRDFKGILETGSK